jgi:hypothetical protein
MVATVPDHLADDRQRAERINRGFVDAEYSATLINWWWTELAQPELGGRTALQAWHDDAPRVEDLAQRYVAKGEDMRTWVQDAHAAVADKSILQRLATQRSPRELLDEWRTEQQSG